MSVNCVAFDFDGTLVQSNEIKKQSFALTAASVPGLTPIVERVLATFKGDRYEIFKKVVALAHSHGMAAAQDESALFERLVSEYTRRCEDSIVVCPEVPGMTSAITGLRSRGLKTFINSATPAEPLRVIVERRGLNPLFDGVYGGPTSKADNLRDIMAKHASDPDRIVFVGDNDVDEDAAREIGCRFLRVDPAASVSDARVPDLTTLVDLVAAR